MYSKRMVLFISFLSLMISADLTAQTTEWTLEWDDPNDPDKITIKQYIVYRHTDNVSDLDNSHIIARVDTPATTFTDAPLQPGEKYFYWVRAVSAEGDTSEFSDYAFEQIPKILSENITNFNSFYMAPAENDSIDFSDFSDTTVIGSALVEDDGPVFWELDTTQISTDTLEVFQDLERDPDGEFYRITAENEFSLPIVTTLSVRDTNGFYDITEFSFIPGIISSIFMDDTLRLKSNQEIEFSKNSFFTSLFYPDSILTNNLTFGGEAIEFIEVTDSTIRIFKDPDINRGSGSLNFCVKIDNYKNNHTVSSCDSVHIIFESKPIATNDSIRTIKNIEKVVPLSKILENDLEASGEILFFDSLYQAAPYALNGTGLIRNDSLVFIPDSNFIGIDSLLYSVRNEQNLKDSALIYISVTPGAPPIATDDSVNILRNNIFIEPFSLFLANDADPDGGIITLDSLFVEVPYAVHGNADIKNDSLFYIPDSGAFGMDSLLYRIVDEQGLVDDAVIYIGIDTIPAPDVAPTAVNDSIIMEYNSTIRIDYSSLLENDFDPLERSIEIDSLKNPVYGSIEKNEAERYFEYNSASDYIEVDTLEYVISNERGAKDSAYVFFVFSPDTLIVRYTDATEDTELELDVVEIMNSGTDKSFDNFKYMYTEEGYPINGSLPEENGNRITYKPNQNYNQTDTLLCVTSNGINSIRVKIVLKIASVNDPPTITLPDITLFNSFGDSAEFDLDSYVSDDTDRRSEHYFPPEMFDWNVIINPEDSTAFRIDTLKLRDRLLALRANREKWTRPVDFLLTATDTMEISSSINVRTTLNSFINFEAPTVVSGTTYILRWETGFIAKSMVRYGINNLDSTSMLYYTATHRHELSNLQENSTYTYAAYVIQDTDTTEAETGTFTTGSSTNVNIFPNPFNPNEIPEHDFIYVSDFPENATFQVFNLLGEPVFNYKNEEGGRVYRWSAVNEKSKKLQSGLYIYVVKDENNKKLLSGKIVIIR